MHGNHAWHACTPCPECVRAKYDPDEYRCNALQRLRRHLHEVLLDQLPVLKGLQRLLDEMALSGGDVAGGASSRAFGGDQGPGGGAGRAARLILEQVPMVREGLLRGRDWPVLAAQLRDTWFGAAAAQLARERAERMLRSFEFLCSLEESAAPQQGQQAAAGAGTGMPPAVGGRVGSGGASGGAGSDLVQVECWRRVRAGVHERWCEFDCRLDGGRPAEPVLVKGEGGTEAHGRRHRLVPLDANATRPLPCDGKVGRSARLLGCAANSACRACVLFQGHADAEPTARAEARMADTVYGRAVPSQIVVRCCGRKAEALLQLPTIAVRSLDSEAPEGLWLTVGLLATDGLALQLRLRRAAKVSGCSGRPCEGGCVARRPRCWRAVLRGVARGLGTAGLPQLAAGGATVLRWASPLPAGPGARQARRRVVFVPPGGRRADAGQRGTGCQLAREQGGRRGQQRRLHHRRQPQRRCAMSIIRLRRGGRRVSLLRMPAQADGRQRLPGRWV